MNVQMFTVQMEELVWMESTCTVVPALLVILDLIVKQVYYRISYNREIGVHKSREIFMCTSIIADCEYFNMSAN